VIAVNKFQLIWNSAIEHGVSKPWRKI
jgi:hypothetical protein